MCLEFLAEAGTRRDQLNVRWKCIPGPGDGKGVWFQFHKLTARCQFVGLRSCSYTRICQKCTEMQFPAERTKKKSVQGLMPDLTLLIRQNSTRTPRYKCNSQRKCWLRVSLGGRKATGKLTPVDSPSSPRILNITLTMRQPDAFCHYFLELYHHQSINVRGNSIQNVQLHDCPPYLHSKPIILCLLAYYKYLDPCTLADIRTTFLSHFILRLQ